MTSKSDRFNYIYSCELDTNVQIKIGTLEGHREHPSHRELINDPIVRFSGAYQDGCSDLYVTCQVFADGKAIVLPVCTAYRAFSTRWNWNEWLTLPVKYSDLPRTAMLALTIWDIYGSCKAQPVGGTTVPLFGKAGVFRQGMHDLRVWPKIEADGTGNPSSTPGKTSGRDDNMGRLAKLSKKHRNGHLAKVDWLDRLTFREIEMINEKQKRHSHAMFLMIEFPRVHFEDTDYTIVYFEQGGDETFHTRSITEIVTVPDPEVALDNLVESKHHKLARSLRSGPTDRDLKPNAYTRDLLNSIVEYPPTKQLTSEEKDLIWKFRFYLSNQKKALAKFLKCVDWQVTLEAKQALDLLTRWSLMDVSDALELLGPTFSHPSVRRYAVARLQQADDEELLLYLLQLVQALKYEDSEEIMNAYEREKELGTVSSPFANAIPTELSTIHDTNTMLTSHDTTTMTTPHDATTSAAHTLSSSPLDQQQLASSFQLKTEVESAMGELVPEVNTESLLDALNMDPTLQTQLDDEETQKADEVDLATFLIRRACHNSKLANYFCWYLIVECDDQDSQTKDARIINMYVTVLKRFSQFLINGGSECRLRRAAIAGQQVFMELLVKLVKLIARESGNRKKKIEKLQEYLKYPEALKFNFSCFDSLPLPLDPDVCVKGIIPDQATLFKSALMPCRFTFLTTDDKKYVTIFKHGDDLRQDQLVLQIITLMDQLLRKENLDLKLTPYKVLATSSKHGFLQFVVDSVAIAEVLSTEGTIINYFRKHAPAENAPYGVAAEVMDNYVKSCAGYCIITYLLGVGDRHLDNLLLTPSGKLVHIDFGFILGRDPKPMPPPMKLSKEMVDAMGGAGSEHFMEFKQLCYTAFLHLRRSANLILNLFSLMEDANVPDIALEPDKTVKKVQDKFRLDLSDEEAVQYIQSVIDVSVSATMAALAERIHKLAMLWKT